MELRQVIRQIEQTVKEVFGADVCNWECLMNNAVKAGQSTHVHWHLYPRYLGGATFAGEEFPDPKWPRHLEDAVHWWVMRPFAKLCRHCVAGLQEISSLRCG